MIRRVQIPLFFVLAYAITWSIQIPAYVYADRRGERLTNEANVVHFTDAFLGRADPAFLGIFLLFSFSFGPTVAGLIVIALAQGREGFRDLGRRLARVRVPPRFVVAVLLIPVALSVAALLLGYVASGFAPFDYAPLVPFALALPFLLHLLVFTAVAEEIGWRGYALPVLQRRHTAERASWILGLAWGLWHLPSNLLPPLLLGQLTVPMAIATVLGLTFGAVGWTLVITWIFNGTGESLFWILVLHGFGNWVQSYLVLSSGSYPAQVAYGVLPWAIALVLLKRYGPELGARPAQHARRVPGASSPA
ncbi:CPBP family intramembrane glutamic endopeptidase [Naasia sp. SYSU D00057]|uniref:CPBP family intramembrane glutamic endopeptidase n=1 Tax=Naasia sp. SYSU D00057 TaxID=2817380 RepID=UPI001B3089EE|nr:CPBP family intramembrane glutamic endopeptidase [Naasia sp. SYSU D00057]